LVGSRAGGPMRHESSILSLSWIPSEAIEGSMRVPFDIGVAHYDDPPPDKISSAAALERLRKADGFRFANRLTAWVEVNDKGRITGAGYEGGGHMGATTLGREWDSNPFLSELRAAAKVPVAAHADGARRAHDS